MAAGAIYVQIAVALLGVAAMLQPMLGSSPLGPISFCSFYSFFANLHWSVKWVAGYFFLLFALISHKRRQPQKLIDIIRLLVLFPFYTCTIAFERRFPHLNPFLNFPRDAVEIYSNPRRFFELLKSKKSSRARIPADAELVSVEPYGRFEVEPAKNDTLAKILLTFRVGSQLTKLPLFVKFQTSRGTDAWVLALISAYADYHNERQFYESELACHMTMPVPEYIAGFYSRTFHRVLSVLLLIPDAVVTVADHKGASRPQMRALLATAASLHARFWRTHTRGREYTLPALALASPAAATSSSSSSSSVVHGLFGVRPPSPTSAESSRHWFARATDHLVARHGVQWIGSIELFAPHHPRGKQWFAPIWTAITEFYRQYPNMTVSHGDCRPGNMLFDPRSDKIEGLPIVFADWEAISYTPYLWDFAYSTTIGQSAETRRAHFSADLDCYLDALARCGVDASEFGASRDEIELHVSLMTIALYFYSWMLQQAGQVGKAQGNTNDDMEEWGNRIHCAFYDHTEKVETLAKALNVPASMVQEMRDYQYREYVQKIEAKTPAAAK